MVKILASRVAGYKLALVVILLLVPVVHFGTQLSVQALQNWRLAQANRAAVALVDLTYRTAIDLSSGWSTSVMQPRLLVEGPELAKQAGVTPEFVILSSALANKNAGSFIKLDAASALIVALGSGSLMNDAGNHEANALASAGGMALSDVMKDYLQMQTVADAQMHDAVGAATNLSKISILSAEVAFHAEEFKNNVDAAMNSSKTPDDYKFLQAKGAQLMLATDKVKEILFDPQLDALAKMQKTSSALRAANKAWTEVIFATWVQLHERLSSMSDTRISELRLWILRTLCWAILSIVFGLGTAIHMFRSTLSKLDELEGSRMEADGARFVAENSAKELEELNGNLATVNSEVNTHLTALEAAQEQLIKKGRMEQMGQLTATMAHELRNPLGAARTSIFLLERKTRDKGLGVESQIQRITNAIMRCDDIITQLLDFSRTKKLSPTSADFDVWLERIVTEEAMRLPQAISISCQLGTGNVPVAFDPARMQRAVTNLLNNASEAMVGNGDDKTKFTVADPRIDITSAVVGSMLQLCVTDNGPGISPENLARVREPLFTTKSFGTGLGLPAVEQIAAQHGGTMHIKSAVGQGTTATILLPLESTLEDAEAA